MKTKFKKNGRRLLAAILCLVMAVMALPMSAFAWTSEEGVSCTSSFGDYYVGSDGGYYRSKSSYSFIVYDSDGNTSVRTISAGNAKRKYLMTDSSGTHQVYCVESGIDFNTGNSYVSQNGKNSSYFRKLPTEAQFGVMMALMYGWHEGNYMPDVEMLSLLSKEFGVSINELISGERLWAEDFKKAADDNLVTALNNSTFTLKEKIVFFKKKWLHEHISTIVLCVVAWIGIIIWTALKLRGSDSYALLGAIGSMLAILFYVVLYNRMMVYVENHAYRATPDKETETKN